MLDLIRHILSAPAGGVTEEKIYTEHCAEFRALNIIFWQIPVIVTTLNGGLWFALASLDLTVWGQRMILGFAVVVNIAFFVALVRLRAIMERLLERIRRFEGRGRERGAYTVLTLFGLLMAIATAGAVVVAANPPLFLKRDAPKSIIILCEAAAGSAPRACQAVPAK
ncbi:hypothetical protein [Brevundimonas sp. FT23042]|uniref:hypothetical protein n=1 Tax=Brevundimonas sp. FT23042 TaxID=3393749 RepID=UPI003B589E40